MVLMWSGWNLSILIIGFQHRFTLYSALHHNNKHNFWYITQHSPCLSGAIWSLTVCSVCSLVMRTKAGSAVTLLLIGGAEATTSSAKLQLYSVFRRKVLFQSVGAEVPTRVRINRIRASQTELLFVTTVQKFITAADTVRSTLPEAKPLRTTTFKLEASINNYCLSKTFLSILKKQAHLIFNSLPARNPESGSKVDKQA